MHDLILKKFEMEMTDLQAAKEARYEAVVEGFCYEVAVYPIEGAAQHKALFSLMWQNDTVALWIPSDDTPYKKAFFIGPVTHDEWLNIVTCIKIFLDFRTENLTFSGFESVPIKTLGTKPYNWHHEQVSYTGMAELEPIIGILRDIGRRSMQVEYNGPDERSYYYTDPEKGTVDYWVRKR